MPTSLEPPSVIVERYILPDGDGRPRKINGSYSRDCETFYWKNMHYSFTFKSEEVFKTLKEACEERTRILNNRQREALEAFKGAYEKYEESMRELKELKDGE